MTPRKLNLFIANFNYGGNGGVSMEVPAVRRWWGQMLLDAKEDPRIDMIRFADFSDTPITMTRNKALSVASDQGADVVIMVDSDQYPDMYHESMNPKPDPNAKPFFQSSFDFLYANYDRGPVMIGAPYCGPPPEECVYIFDFNNTESDDPNKRWSLNMISRGDAARRAGIAPVAALPTGLMMLDLRVLDYMSPPYFDYEYTNKFHTEKASTEDVYFTRNTNLFVYNAIKTHACYCNWDAWAGHWKPKLVGKPFPPTLDHIHQGYAEAVRDGYRATEKLQFVQGQNGMELLPSANGDAKGRMLAAHERVPI